jgi:hypothetical protein
VPGKPHVTHQGVDIVTMAIMSAAVRLPDRCPAPPMAATHDMAHSFGVVDAVPVKTDEGGDSHRTRHGTGRRHGVASI